MDSKNFIKNKLKAYNNNLDLTEGSAITQVFVNPLSSILQPLLDEQDKLLNNFSLQNPSAMDSDDLDAVASNYLISRRTALNAAGNIKLYYNAAVSVNIPKDTMVSTEDGKMYKTTATYAITKAGMASNREKFPLYNTANIPIESIGPGLDNNIKAGEITKLVTAVVPAPIQVTNPQAVYGATSPETNDELKTRIQQTFFANSVTNPNGIKKLISSLYPTVTKTSVKGFGDTEMVRDTIISGMSAQDFYSSDLNYNTSGLSLPPHNPSAAYYGRFTDIDPSTNVTLPAQISDFFNEFTNNMYYGVYRKDDANYAESAEHVILDEQFNATGILAELGWITSDGRTGVGNVAVPMEIRTLSLTGDNDGVKILGRKKELSQAAQDQLEYQIEYLESLLNSMDNFLYTFTGETNQNDENTL
tara:strand:+ start:12610 stop:13860 length:1251 start_codon:yes stop_codon:yes gene_type:complete